MKEVIIKGIFMGIIAPVIIITGLIFGIDYLAPKYINYTADIIYQKMKKETSIGNIFNPVLSEMKINEGAIPPDGFFGLKYTDPKSLYIEKNIINDEGEVLLDKEKMILKSGRVYFNDDETEVKMYTFSSDSQYSYASVKEALTIKYGTPKKVVDLPSSILSLLFEPLDFYSGSVISTWILEDHNIKIELRWRSFFSHKITNLLNYSEKKGFVIITYSRLSYDNQITQDKLNSYDYF